MANVEGASRRGPGVAPAPQSSAVPQAADSVHMSQTQAQEALAGEITEFETRVRALLAQHAAVLLQEPLLTVWSAAGIASDGHHKLPAVVALDKQGRQVVVTVAYRLTPQGILDAIMCTGRFGYLTRTQIAEHYPGGSLEFEFAVANFYGEDRDTSARIALPSTNARLVIVCGDVDPDSHGAMRFLHGSGGIVEVLPLTAQVVNRVVQQVRDRATGGQPPSTPTPVQPAPTPTPRQTVPVQPAPTAPAPTKSATAAAPSSTAPVQVPPQASVAPPANPHLPSPPVPADSPSAPQPTFGAQSQVGAEPSPPSPAATPPAEPQAKPQPTASAQPIEPQSAPSESAGTEKPELHPQRRAEPLTITTEIPIVESGKRALPRTVLPRPANKDNRPPARSLAVRTVALEAAVSGRSAESIVSGIGTQQQRDLKSLCAELESTVPLVWQPSNSDKPLVAMLDPSGTITTDSGLTFTSPTRAAKAVAGTLSSSIDGWDVWRIGERGPTLAEAWQEIFG